MDAHQDVPMRRKRGLEEERGDESPQTGLHFHTTVSRTVQNVLGLPHRCQPCQTLTYRHQQLIDRKVDVRLPKKRESNLPWNQADSPNHHGDKVDSDQ